MSGNLSLQTWIKHYKQIRSLVHLPSLHSVYMGLNDGSVLAYHDELPSQPLVSLDSTLKSPPLVALNPVAQYKDSSQITSCILAIPQSNQSNQSGSNDPVKETYELWVGQRDNKITVLDAATLKVVKFLQNSLDQSIMPSFVAYLSCTHLVYGCTARKGVASSKGEGLGSCDHMSVYSALRHGQYVTRWNSQLKKPMDSFDCRSRVQGQTTPTRLFISHTPFLCPLQIASSPPCSTPDQNCLLG